MLFIAYVCFFFGNSGMRNPAPVETLLSVYVPIGLSILSLVLSRNCLDSESVYGKVVKLVFLVLGLTVVCLSLERLILP